MSKEIKRQRQTADERAHLLKRSAVLEPLNPVNQTYQGEPIATLIELNHAWHNHLKLCHALFPNVTTLHIRSHPMMHCFPAKRNLRLGLKVNIFILQFALINQEDELPAKWLSALFIESSYYLYPPNKINKRGYFCQSSMQRHGLH